MRAADEYGRIGPHPSGTDPVALRRRATRCQDVLTVLLALLAATGLVAGWAAGGAAHAGVQQRSALETAVRTPVQAVVVHRSGSVAEMQTGQQWATVGWTGRDGRERVGDTTLTGMYEPGDRVQGWLDGAGDPAPPPTSAEDAVVVGVAAGLLTVLGWSIAVVLLGIGCRRWTAARVARAWELAWARVEPDWSGRRRG